MDPGMTMFWWAMTSMVPNHCRAASTAAVTLLADPDRLNRWLAVPILASTCDNVFAAMAAPNVVAATVRLNSASTSTC
jgi:hypothetical protein